MPAKNPHDARAASSTPARLNSFPRNSATPNSPLIKASELKTLLRCSRGVAAKLAAREDFPQPVSLSNGDYNLRYFHDEVVAWLKGHRREVRGMAASPRRRPRSAEDAVRTGLTELRKQTPKPGNFQ